MRLFAIGAILITLPAVVAAVYALLTGHTLILYAALASMAINWLPFLAAMFLLRGHGDEADLSH